MKTPSTKVSAAPDFVRIQPYSDTDVPESMDGSKGSNRAPAESMAVPLADDREAVGYFLQQYSASLGTHRIYSRECERLALWAVHVCQKALSSLGVRDLENYIRFLGNPSPQEQWCGPKAKRKTEKWRPFVGPLDVSARLTAMSAINSMYSYWVQAGYITGNPLGLFRQLKQKIVNGAFDEAPGSAAGSSSSPAVKTSRRKHARKAVKVADGSEKVERYLDSEMWQAVLKAVDGLAPQGYDPANPDQDGLPPEARRQVAEYERARFFMAFLYLMAPRVGELETHNMNSFREERGMWWWHVVGKGAKYGKVAVPEDMLQALVRYRRHLGLPPIPSAKDDSPLLRSTRYPGEPITARRLNQILKDIFEAACAHLPPGSEHKAEKMRQASAHWGRHTGITAKIDSGMDAFNVQRDARHADFRTTQRYIHGTDETRHDDAQKVHLAS